MSKILFGITWAQWHYIFYFPILLGIVFVVCWAYCKRKSIIRLLVNDKNRTFFIHNYSSAKHIFKCILLVIGFILLGITALKPRWDKKDTLVRQERRDIIICFDISRSMLAQDCMPNRLSLAKQKIQRLIQKLSCERVALVLFAESAIVQCPLTDDHAAFLMFLNFIDEHTMAQGSTMIAQALKKGIEIYRGLPSKKTKLMLFCTDGEDFSSDLQILRQQIKDEGIGIITLGVGTEQGAPVPILDQEGTIIGHQKDEKGGIVVSRLDEEVLSSMAHEIGGIYVRAQVDTDKDLDSIVAYVNHLEKDQIEDKQLNELQEQYSWFVLGSFICFLIEWLL